MDDLISLTAADWFEIRGRGWVATFSGIDGLNPRELTGQRVSIDGKEYTVRGVEAYAITNVTGKPFGLLIGER